MRRVLWIPLAGLAIVAAFGLTLLPDTSISQPGNRYLSLDSAPGPKPGVFETGAVPIPPDGSSWHELYPAYCSTSTQDGYEDNGDGMISSCDRIILDGTPWHIVWVGPTYYMTCFGATGTQPVVAEPNQGPHEPGNPICEEWHEVWPQFCQIFHVDQWLDNDASGNLTPCDDIFSGGLRYHIDDIRTDIIIEPTGTPVEKSTWGEIKRWMNEKF